MLANLFYLFFLKQSLQSAYIAIISSIPNHCHFVICLLALQHALDLYHIVLLCYWILVLRHFLMQVHK